MKLSSLFLLPLFALLFTSCNAQDGAKDINADDFEKGIAHKGVLVVDVRTPEEHAEKYIPGSGNIDINNEATFNKEFSKLDKNKPLYLYCLSGARSAKAGVIAKKNGFKEVYNLHGGIMSWISSGKNIETLKAVPASGGLTFDEYLDNIKRSNKLVLVDFSAVWCGPCRMLKPIVDKVVKQNADKVELYPLDVDKNPGVASAMHIQSIPLLVMYKNGKEVWRNLGLTDEDTVEEAVKKHSK